MNVDRRDDLLSKYMLVKADKPNSCYTYVDLIGNLKNIQAEELAKALKCSTLELNAKTGFELLYSAVTRFKSIIGYR